MNGKTQAGACSFSTVCTLGCTPKERDQCRWWANNPEKPKEPEPEKLTLVEPREVKEEPK